MSPRSLAVVLLALAALLPAVAPSPASAMLKGLQDDEMLASPDPAVRATFWRDAERAGVRRVRTLVRWTPQWRAPDPVDVVRVLQAGEEARAIGARLLVGVYAPIARGRPSFRVTPAMIDRYGRFMTALAEALHDAPVAAYLTYNEPNFRSMWPQRQAASWVKLSNAAYDAVKEVDPDVDVLVGETSSQAAVGGGSTTPGAFLRKALCLDERWRRIPRDTAACDRMLLADGVAVHTYDIRRPNPLTPGSRPDEWTAGNLASVRRQLRARARAGKLPARAARNIHVTEYALRTTGPRAVPRRTAATYLRRAWTLARRHGIRSFTWYGLRDPRDTDHAWQSGLRGRGGTPRPVFSTFRRLR